MIYVTADLHLDHTNIIKYQASTRPFSSIGGMNESIINTWNKVAKPSDDIYVLGDITVGNRASKLIKRLNGRIHLIRGNHDKFSKAEEDELFETVEDYKVLKYQKERFVMFHYPIETWDRGHYGAIHLHGHCHGGLTRKIPNRFDMGWDVHQRLVPIDVIKTWQSVERITHH